MFMSQLQGRVRNEEGSLRLFARCTDTTAELVRIFLWDQNLTHFVIKITHYVHHRSLLSAIYHVRALGPCLATTWPSSGCHGWKRPGPRAETRPFKGHSHHAHHAVSVGRSGSKPCSQEIFYVR